MRWDSGHSGCQCVISIRLRTRMLRLERSAQGGRYNVPPGMSVPRRSPSRTAQSCSSSLCQGTRRLQQGSQRGGAVKPCIDRDIQNLFSKRPAFGRELPGFETPDHPSLVVALIVVALFTGLSELAASVSVATEEILVWMVAPGSSLASRLGCHRAGILRSRERGDEERP